MKIASIEAFPLEYPEPHYKGTLRYITLAKVTADDGTAGWGECISQFPESALATATIIERGYAPLLVGADPLDVEALWRTMTGRTWWYGPEGIAAFGLERRRHGALGPQGQGARPAGEPAARQPAPHRGAGHGLHHLRHGGHGVDG